ncbi:acyltransferase family protein [Rhodanobacter ginsengiterrae]|uniref:acyltransferase family protein n=1 Tax=Rhodanobacter ginsengiterrae TaxID=2008451 RepID=UPI003CF4ADE1
MDSPRPLPSGSHANNFDGLRLVASLMVLVSHQFVLLGMHESTLAQGMTLGSIAVAMFFAMSGYLVTESWFHDPHIMRFAMRRFLRIWPALIVATLVIVIAGAALSTLPLHEYFGRETRRFITFNAQLRAYYTLPGVFATIPANASLSAVNGSWWTIPLEAKCYAYLAVLGAIGLRRRVFTLLALAGVAVMYVKTLPGHSREDAFDNICYFYTAFFLAGAASRQFIAEIRRHRLLLACGVAACLMAAALLQHARLAQWAVLVPLTLWFGQQSTPGLRSAARFGDLSYSAYLYAYFVQQLTVHLWPTTPSYLATTSVAALVTALIAWGSWHAVEAPALSLKRRLRSWFPDFSP